MYIDIRNYKELKPFTVTLPNGNDFLVDYSGNMLFAYNYYFEIWDNCKEFGLPERDWTKNPSWLIDLVKMFNHCNNDVMEYRTKRRR